MIEKRIFNGQPVNTPLAEAQALAMKHSHDDEAVTVEMDYHGGIVGVCPDCGGALRHEEGCQKCYACGFSKC